MNCKFQKVKSHSIWLIVIEESDVEMQDMMGVGGEGDATRSKAYL